MEEMNIYILKDIMNFLEKKFKIKAWRQGRRWETIAEEEYVMIVAISKINNDALNSQFIIGSPFFIKSQATVE